MNPELLKAVRENWRDGYHTAVEAMRDYANKLVASPERHDAILFAADMVEAALPPCDLEPKERVQ